MEFPRVIIIGETFRLYGGGGITLTNLFKDWPHENIGVVTDMIGLTNPDTAYSYYQLGFSEIKFPFPFHLLQTYFKSGPCELAKTPPVQPGNKPMPGDKWFARLKKTIRPAFDNLLNRTGLFTYFYKIKLSDSLRNWILDFKPDIIYVQPFYHHLMRFGNLVYMELKIPYAVHIMDDSVMYVNKTIFFKNQRQKKIETDFRELLGKASVRMCISEEMAKEYTRRYGGTFLHFRNPIDVTQWLDNKPAEATISDKPSRILYMGRTYPPYFESLIDVCSVVDKLRRKGRNLSISVSPVEKNPEFISRTKDYSGLESYKHVSFREIPELMRQYDVLLICEDFDEEAQKYLRFSISTRASEGMISGVPVLIYSPGESALSKYFSRTGSGLVVSERNLGALEEAVIRILEDKDLRKRVSENGIKTAMDDSDSAKVRNGFRKALILHERND